MAAEILVHLAAAWAMAAVPMIGRWPWARRIGNAPWVDGRFKVTGLPATEARRLRSRGDAVRAHQRRVSALVPRFPRRAEGA